MPAGPWVVRSIMVFPADFVATKELKVRNQGAEGGLVVGRIAGHLCLWIAGLRIVHISGEILGRGCSPGGEHQPWTVRFPSAFRSQVVAAKTILLRDAISILHLGIVGAGSAGGNCAEDVFCVAKLEAYDSPGNLRFVLMREDFEARREGGMRNHVRTHIAAVTCRILWPAGRRFSVDSEDEQGMVGGNVSIGIVGAVLVAAYGDDQVRFGRRSQISK